MFTETGTTGLAALSLGRNCILIDNNKDYYLEAITIIKKELPKIKK